MDALMDSVAIRVVERVSFWILNPEKRTHAALAAARKLSTSERRLIDGLRRFFWRTSAIRMVLFAFAVVICLVNVSILVCSVTIFASICIFATKKNAENPTTRRSATTLR